MTDEPKPPSDGSFEARLEAARRANAPQPAHGTQGGAMGTAFRLSADLVSAVVAGGGLGWALDWLFGTGPWLLMLFFFLGVAAGILNVIRTANEMNAAQQTDSAMPDTGAREGLEKDRQGNGLEH
ncbi:MAG: AtpZ/AtpI family protein [Alphaproteobacteria bacterium]